MPKWISLLALVVVLAPQQQVFRSGTELVEVDVVVLDSAGRLVRGLTADDFELYDEGDRREVATFSFVDVEPGTVDAGGTVLAEPGLSSSDTHRAAAVYLIVLDYLFTPSRLATRMRQQAAEFVRDHMRPSDLAAVIHLGLTSGAVEFSSDKATLVASIERVRGSADAIGANPTPDVALGGGEADAQLIEALGELEEMEVLQQATRAEHSYEMLEAAAEYVGGFTGRRKSMLLFTSGVPIRQADPDPNPQKREASSRFSRAHQQLVTMARQSSVSVNTLDPAGLSSAANSAGASLGGHNPAAFSSSMPSLNQDENLRALAHETGGRAILRNNDMTAPFAQIARDNGSFYLLGFRPESSDPNKFRRLQVKVKRENVQVFARQGYGGDARRNATLARTLARAWEGKTVADLLDRPLPGRSAGLPMRASASVIRRSETGATALLMVEVDAGAIPANATKLEVGYRAIGADGKPAAARIDATNMQVSPRTRAAIDANGWRYLTTIDLPPGAYQLRVAAREETSGAYGTVFLDVAVPDLARETIAIDSVVIGSSTTGATPTAAPQRALLQTWPVLPTTRREFNMSETLVAFIQLSTLKVEQASVRVEVEDADGRPVAGTTYEAGPESLKAGGAPIAHQVPLSAIAPGDYVLKVSVTPPNAPAPAATRAIPFSVRTGVQER